MNYDLSVYIITNHQNNITVPQVFLDENDAVLYLQIARTNTVTREEHWKIVKINLNKYIKEK